MAEPETTRDMWKERSASWIAFADPGRSSSDTLNQLIIEAAGIGECDSRDRILDIASGTGDPAISIALALPGAGKGAGSLTACDLTPPMLAAARSRAGGLGIDGIRFVAGTMAALPFRDAVFDCVTCRFGLMFPEDKIAAAKEALRVLAPGGRAIYAVWGPYEDNPSFHVIRRALAEYFGEEDPPPSQRHSLGRPGQVREILEGAGFAQVEERTLVYPRPIDDLGEFVTRMLKRNHADKLEGLDETRSAKLKEALARAYEPYREDGVVTLENHVHLGLGRKG